MFLCAECLKDMCDVEHLAYSFGPCEKCRKTTDCQDCVCYKRKSRPESLTTGEIRTSFLEHMRSLAKISAINPRDVSVTAQLSCAIEMCRLAGVSQAAIDDVLLDAKVG